MAIFEKFENAPGISPNKKSPTCVKFLDFLTPLEINFLGCLNFKIVDHF